MGLEAFTTAVVDFVRNHQMWAAPIVFLLAFGESLAFVSLILPSTVILVGIAGMAGAAAIPIIPMWLGAVIGSILGYAVSYWIGLHFKDNISTIWPFSAYPDMVPRGTVFFRKYGTLSVFFGHLMGPVRAVIPVVAGMYSMPQLPFQIANALSSVVWSTTVLLPAYFGHEYIYAAFKWIVDLVSQLWMWLGNLIGY